MEFIKTLWKNKKIAWKLGKSDFKNRFASTSLGSIWGFLQPFIFMIMYVIVFQGIFGMEGDNGSPYVVWFLPGMALWQAINDSVMSSINIFNVSCNSCMCNFWIYAKCIYNNIYNNSFVCVFNSIYKIYISINNTCTRLFKLTWNINATIFLGNTCCMECNKTCRTYKNITNNSMYAIFIFDYSI